MLTTHGGSLTRFTSASLEASPQVEHAQLTQERAQQIPAQSRSLGSPSVSAAAETV